MVSSNPIEKYDGPIKSKRQLPDEINLNKQFFDEIFQASRKSRDTADDEVAPTIALHDLISAVEHTLIHSAQNLAASNVTGNLTAQSAEADTNNVSNIQHIVLPITIPTPEPKPIEIATESVDETTVSEEDEESVTEHKSNDYESVKPLESSNLGILLPISLNPSVNTSHVVLDEEQKDAPAPVTEETTLADQSNITILHTINSTQLIPNESDEGVHLHQQKITIFSANAGVFPNIHAFLAEDLPILSQQASSPQPEEEEEDCSGEETSPEADDSTSSSEEDSSSDSSSEEKDKVKKTGCSRKSSVAVSNTAEATTPSVEVVKKIQTDELKTKIAEVEADPVILTQGI